MIQDDEDIENEKSEMSEKEKRVLREQRKPDWAKSMLIKVI